MSVEMTRNRLWIALFVVCLAVLAGLPLVLASVDRGGLAELSREVRNARQLETELSDAALRARIGQDTDWDLTVRVTDALREEHRVLEQRLAELGGISAGLIQTELREYVAVSSERTERIERFIGEGTGQGLAIARCVIVDKHAGTIDVKTQAGEGTTFRIAIPLQEAA
jgi:signal transduction histidine kinase